MKKTALWLISLICIMLYIMVLFITCIELVAFDMGFYRLEYERLNRPQSIGMTQGDLLRVTGELLDYLKDNRDDLDITAFVNGEERRVFNRREIEHMVDVKALYLGAKRVRNISTVLLPILAALLLYMAGKELKRYLAVACILCISGLLILLGLLGILIKSDFTAVWDQFHYIFFSNDLWQLNPDTDILIQMVPEDFFLHMVQRIILYFLVGIIIPFFLAVAYFIRFKKSHA